MQATRVILHFLVATLRKRKNKKQTVPVNFNNGFCLTQNTKNIISACNQYKNYKWNIFLFLYFLNSCLYFILSVTFIVGLAAYQVLGCRKEIVVPILVSVVLELYWKSGFDQHTHCCGRHVESRASLQSCWVRICILSNPQGCVPRVHNEVGETGLEDFHGQPQVRKAWLHIICISFSF